MPLSPTTTPTVVVEEGEQKEGVESREGMVRVLCQASSEDVEEEVYVPLDVVKDCGLLRMQWEDAQEEGGAEANASLYIDMSKASLEEVLHCHGSLATLRLADYLQSEALFTKCASAYASSLRRQEQLHRKGGEGKEVVDTNYKSSTNVRHGQHKENVMYWVQSGVPLCILWGILVMKSGTVVLYGDRKYVYLIKPDGKTLKLKGHSKDISCVKELTSGRLASASRDTTIRIWNEDGDCLDILRGHEFGVIGLVQLADESLVSVDTLGHMVFRNDMTASEWSKFIRRGPMEAFPEVCHWPCDMNHLVITCKDAVVTDEAGRQWLDLSGGFSMLDGCTLHLLHLKWRDVAFYDICFPRQHKRCVRMVSCCPRTGRLFLATGNGILILGGNKGGTPTLLLDAKTATGKEDQGPGTGPLTSEEKSTIDFTEKEMRLLFSDVKSLDIQNHGFLVSASADNFVRVWAEHEDGRWQVLALRNMYNGEDLGGGGGVAWYPDQLAIVAATSDSIQSWRLDPVGLKVRQSLRRSLAERELSEPLFMKLQEALKPSLKELCESEEGSVEREVKQQKMIHLVEDRRIRQYRASVEHLPLSLKVFGHSMYSFTSYI